MPIDGHSTDDTHHGDGQQQAPGVDSSSDPGPMTSHEEHGGGHETTAAAMTANHDYDNRPYCRF